MAQLQCLSGRFGGRLSTQGLDRHRLRPRWPSHHWSSSLRAPARRVTAAAGLRAELAVPSESGDEDDGELMESFHDLLGLKLTQDDVNVYTWFFQVTELHPLVRGRSLRPAKGHLGIPKRSNRHCWGTNSEGILNMSL